MSTPLDKLNAKVFSEHLHTKFKVHLGDAAPMTLELVEVKDSDPSPQIELFTLHFLGPAAPRLPQQTHRLEHDKLGIFEIFLTAISAEPQGILYESVFHRFRTPPAPQSKDHQAKDNQSKDHKE
ncbi:MAG TPA: hypothetical protein VH724_01565 [Candidatus Angelobacter sp.]|nr:hypothetical protein [Candidatus Angelobacter sp.]